MIVLYGSPHTKTQHDPFIHVVAIHQRKRTFVYTQTRSIALDKLDGKYSERVQLPAKAFLSPALGNTCHTYYFAAR